MCQSIVQLILRYFLPNMKMTKSTESRKRKSRTKAAEKIQVSVRRLKGISERKFKKLNDEKNAEDPLEELFGGTIEDPGEKEFDGFVADLPECQADMKGKDRKEDLETKLWSLSETDEKWFPFYVFMARFALAQQRQRQISISRTMENACYGYANQYIRIFFTNPSTNWMQD